MTIDDATSAAIRKRARELADAAPPLSDEQKVRLRALLRPPPKSAPRRAS